MLLVSKLLILCSAHTRHSIELRAGTRELQMLRNDESGLNSPEATTDCCYYVDVLCFPFAIEPRRRYHAWNVA